MKLYIPNPTFATFNLYKSDLYKIVGPLPMMAVPRIDEVVRIELGDDEFYQGKVTHINWRITHSDGDDIQMVDIYLKEWRAGDALGHK